MSKQLGCFDKNNTVGTIEPTSDSNSSTNDAIDCRKTFEGFLVTVLCTNGVNGIFAIGTIGKTPKGANV